VDSLILGRIVPEEAVQVTSDEREELRRLRRELAEVKKANEILVKAAAFFAKEIVK
jgi:transposase